MNRAIAGILTGAVLAIGTIGVAAPARADGVPYTDPAKTGYFGFCDAQGHNVTSGSLDAVPFVASAVSSVPAPSPYDGKGRVAFVDAYQPRQGVTPPEWSGEELISASAYTNPAHPMVVTTKGDISLRQFVQDYPPSWHGFVQLRMYLKTPDLPFDSLHYATADLQVDQNTWHLIGGGSVPCGAGHAQSIASILAPAAAKGRLNPALHTPVAGTSSTAHASAGGSRNARSSGATGSAPAAAASDSGPPPAAGAASSGDRTSFPTGYVVLGLVIAVLAIALVYTRRRELLSVLQRSKADDAN